MKKIAFAGLLMAMTFLRPVTAGADTLTLASPYLGKGLGLNITYGPSGSTTTKNVWVGEIKWNLNGTFPAIVSYCVDLLDMAIGTETVAVKTTNELNGTNSQGVLAGTGGRAAWLFNTFHIDASTDNNKAAALQLAIWQALYGQSFVSVANSTVMDLAASYLSQSAGQTSVATYFDADNTVTGGHGQDQISTPEPATILLLTLGVGASLGYRRRVNRRRTAA